MVLDVSKRELFYLMVELEPRSPFEAPTGCGPNKLQSWLLMENSFEGVRKR